MRLYNYCLSSASYRVRIALALKGVAYDYVAINIARTVRAQREESYRQVNAMRQVPVLEWRGADDAPVRLTQSVAIIEYLDERFPEPPLFAQDCLLRARQREVVEIINAGIQPLQNSHTMAVLREAGGVELEVSFRSEAITRGLTALEQLARTYSTPFFTGKSPSVADVFLVPQLFSARRFDVAVTPYPRLLEIEREALALPAFRAAHPERQPDASSPERTKP